MKDKVDLKQVVNENFVLESISFKQSRPRLPEYGRLVINKDDGSLQLNLGTPHRPNWTEVSSTSEVAETSSTVNVDISTEVLAEIVPGTNLAWHPSQANRLDVERDLIYYSNDNTKYIRLSEGDDKYLQLAGKTGGQYARGGLDTTDTLKFAATAGIGADGANVEFLYGDDGASRAAYFDYQGQFNLEVLPHATSDSDSFLVTDSGVVKYRTGDEILSDLGISDLSTMFELDNDTINALYPLNISSLNILPDSGIVSIATQDVTSDSNYGDLIGFALNASEYSLRYYGTADGAGAIVDPILDVEGNITISNGSEYRIDSISINVGGTLSNVAYLDQENIFTGAENTFKDIVLSPEDDRIIYVDTPDAVGNGYDLDIHSGHAKTTGVGGSLNLYAGNSSLGGGNVYIYGGTGSTAGEVWLGYTSGGFRGEVRAKTQSSSDDSTKVATTEYVEGAVSDSAITLHSSATTGGLSLSGQEISFRPATTSQTGYLTDTDWDTFNDKAPTHNPTFTGTVETPIIKITTGAVAGYYLKSDASGIASWAAITVAYKGTWNANTNTPTLADGTGTAGDWYRCVVSGSTDFGAGSITFAVGDDAFYSGTVWEKVPGQGYTLQTASATTLGGIKIGFGITMTGDVASITNIPNLTGPITSSGLATSIASQTGTGTKFVMDTSPTIITPTITSFVNSKHDHSNDAGGGVLSTTDIVEGTNLYYTQARFDSALAVKDTDDLSEGSNLYYTDERSQDSVGSILLDTTSIDFTYDDATPNISAVVLPGGVDHDLLLNFVSDEHIAHSSVSIIAGTGLLTGGTIEADVTVNIDPDYSAFVYYYTKTEIDAFFNTVAYFQLENDDTLSSLYTLNISSLHILPDSGMITIANQDVTSDSDNGQEIGFKQVVNGETIIESKAIADGAGGTTDKATEVHADLVIHDKVDDTKEVVFDLSEITTGNKRTLIIPDADGKISLTYKHDQASSSATWTINHNLNSYPSVVAKDSAGTTVAGQVDYTNLNTITLTFNAAFTGVAVCN